MTNINDSMTISYKRAIFKKDISNIIENLEILKKELDMNNNGINAIPNNAKLFNDAISFSIYLTEIKDEDNNELHLNFKNGDEDILSILFQVRQDLEETRISMFNKIDDLKNNNKDPKNAEIISLYGSISQIKGETISSFFNKKYLQKLIMHRAFSELNLYKISIQESYKIVNDKEKDLTDRSEIISQKEEKLSKKEEEIAEQKKNIGEKLIQAERDRQEQLDLKNKLIGRYAEKVYSEAATMYFKKEHNMTLCFYGVILSSLIIILQLSIHFPIDSEHIINPILLRIFFASVAVVLVTFFLRRSTYYNRLGFNAKQTSLELEALPFFMRNVESDKQHEIYTNLAEKYFGKELDQTQNDKIADIVQDQMKMNIEVIASAAQAIKTVSEVKSNNSTTNNKEDKS